ncbi:MAG: hypothetical protein K940chlam8_00307 [Chlamydiae bacterium]|nr:hypothetical protein [Chlamydiota bacterium]
MTATSAPSAFNFVTKWWYGQTPTPQPESLPDFFSIAPIQVDLARIRKANPHAYTFKVDARHLRFFSHQTSVAPRESIETLRTLAIQCKIEFDEELKRGFEDFINYTQSGKFKGATLTEEQTQQLQNNTRHIIHFLKTKADLETKRLILCELAQAGTECSHSHFKATESICKTYIFKQLSISYFKLDIQRKFLQQCQEVRVKVFKEVIAKQQESLRRSLKRLYGDAVLKWDIIDVTKDSGYLAWTHLFASRFGLDSKLGVKAPVLEDRVNVDRILNKLLQAYLKELWELVPKHYSPGFQEWVDHQHLTSKNVYYLPDGASTYKIRDRYQILFLTSLGVTKLDSMQSR